MGIFRTTGEITKKSSHNIAVAYEAAAAECAPRSEGFNDVFRQKCRENGVTDETLNKSGYLKSDGTPDYDKLAGLSASPDPTGLGFG